MVDAIISRRDPDLVRQAREDAKKLRGVWGSHANHGMAILDAQSTAEEMTMIMARLEKLAMSTCKADPRRKSDRMADALFATVMGREFGCQCPDDPKHPCTAEIVTVPADQVKAPSRTTAERAVVAVDRAENNCAPAVSARSAVISARSTVGSARSTVRAGGSAAGDPTRRRVSAVGGARQ